MSYVLNIPRIESWNTVTWTTLQSGNPERWYMYIAQPPVVSTTLRR